MLGYLLDNDNINYRILFSTIFFLVLGIFYYLYRLKRINEHLEEVNNEAESSANNDPQTSNVSNNEIKHFNIYIFINGRKHNFNIRSDQIIKEFIEENVKPLTNNQDVFLIFSGQILKETETFKLYEHRLSDGVVFLSKIKTGENNSNLNNSNYYNDSNANNNDRLLSDPQSVSVYTIFTHVLIIALLSFIIFSYKTCKEIFTRQTIMMIQLLAVFWAFSLSNTIMKLAFYKKIAY